MGYSLGVDTGGTYTDAVVIDAEARAVKGSAKALTTRDDLAIGIGGAVDAALSAAGVGPQDIALVSLSTTLATNALVEGQGGRVALVAIGFTGADLARAGLAEAMGGDPVIVLAGGHGASGEEAAPLDEALLASELQRLGSSVAGFAVTARFATRNPAHEMRARDIIAAATGLPVFLHQRESHADFKAILSEHRDTLTAVVVHCFTDNETALADYLALDCHIGITGWVCDERRGQALYDIVDQIPDERLMIETDCPYLLPRTIRPKPKSRRNEPAYLPWVAERVAQARGQSVDHINTITTANAARFFGIDIPV